MGDDTDNIFALVQNHFSAAYAVASTVVLDEEEELKNALSKRPRKQEFPEKKMRRKFDHCRAYQCILDDYLSANANFIGKDFEHKMGVSRARFQAIFDDIGASGNPVFFGGHHLSHPSQYGSF